jgi:hypothetical protein
MPATALAQTITVTKLSASGNFQFLVQSPSGGVRYVFALLSADMATAAALTSGNTSTFTYGQDGANPTGPTRNDYPVSYAQETF